MATQRQVCIENQGNYKLLIIDGYMKNSERGWALITGATSGLGKIYAQELAKKGINLIITGRREELLATLATSLMRDHAVTVDVIAGDLSEVDVVDKVINRAMQVSRLQFLISNAGYGSKTDFLQDSVESEGKMVKVHVEATIRLCHALALHVVTPSGPGKGGIILVSSLAAFFSSADSIMYCSTKAFLNSFAKSLALRLYDRGIPVQALCPGYTRTEFHDKLDIPTENLKNRGLIRWMSASKVVEVSLRKLQLGKVIVIPGLINRFIKFISLIIPFRIYIKLAPARGKIFK